MNGLLAETAGVLRSVHGMTAHETGTGGNCTALLVHADSGPDGMHALITDGNLGTDVESTGEVVGCLYLSPDHDEIVFVDMAAADSQAEPHALASSIASALATVTA